MAANRLAGETSPYLLQHADNPVDWRPWSAEALSEAGRSGRPILLSIGYAACHWCHVMAHESFENEAIAAQMNADFVPIKVDREERPDLDQIYQAALAMLGQQGGWPLTMFLTPDGEPFWGGTYFPPEPRWGRPGFPEVLRAVAQVWRDEPDRVRHNVSALTEGLGRHATARPGPQSVPDGSLDQIAERFLEAVDPTWGGLRGAPKFPQPAILELLWRFWRRTGAAVARDQVLRSLEAMAEGGIYDHAGGGFARYSTDEQWLVPHFEKMLYDNAELTRVMTLVWRTTRDPLLARRIEETIGWVLRDMRVEGGAFAASLDADSEGEEGRYYVWDEAEIDQALGDEAPPFKRAYEVTPEGNWEGRTILNRRLSPGWRGEEEEARFARCLARLEQIRAKRVRPGRDDKVLADWNGLMIAAMAEAGAVFARPDWVEAATTAYGAVRNRLRRPDGRLLHSWRNGRGQHLASIDDLAAMIRAALALHQGSGDARLLDDAEMLAEAAWVHHWDQAAGGHFFTADDAEALIVRPKSVGDQATPNGNAMMVDNLTRLFGATGRRHYADRRDRLIAAFSGEIERNLFGLGTFLNGVETARSLVEIVVVGPRDNEATRTLLAEAHRTPLVDRAIRLVEPGEALPEGHPAAGKSLVEGRPAAYVCQDFSCLPPAIGPDELGRVLGDLR